MRDKAAASGSLTDAAYNQLKQWIIDCDLAPGQWLTERQLSEQLNVGLSPVRGALARLDHEGLVTTSPRRGYRVTMLTLKTVHDLFTAWSVIAPAMAQLAAAQITPEQLKSLTRQIDKMQRQRVNNAADMKKTLDNARRVFTLIAAAANNGPFEEIFERLDNNMRRTYLYAYSIDPSGHLALNEHPISKEWSTAFEKRDGEKIAELVRGHLTQAHDVFIRTLSSSPAIMATPLV